MNGLRTIVVATLVAVSAAGVLAQPGGGPGAGGGPRGPGPGASAPGMGMGPGGRAGGGRWGADHTPGWALMTPQERNEHRDRMRSMQTYEDCKAYQQQHHQQMAARASERGGKALAAPRRDACLGLKK